MWLNLLMFWMVALAVAINQPVYKVILTQDGPNQFLQYELETPPLVEFTFCTWVRLYDLDAEQTIFSYNMVKRNRTIVRLWMAPGGRNVTLTINGYLATTSPIEIIKDVWKHICISYQSDFGASALYVDSRLVTCGASRTFHGFVIPGGGSVSVGFGRSRDGTPIGLEGEIFGANMILLSTIERNYTKNKNPRLKQRRFQQNTIIKNRAYYDHIVLDEIIESDIFKNYVKTPTPSASLFNLTTLPSTSASSTEREILDIAIPIRTKTKTIGLTAVTSTTQYNESANNTEPYSAETSNLPSLSEFETPPSPTQKIFFKQKHEEKLSISAIGLRPTETQIDNLSHSEKEFRERYKTSQENYELSETEVPPPPQTDNKVYLGKLNKGLSPIETKKDNFKDSEKEFRERLQPSQDDYELSETEVPPPPQTDNKVYLSKFNKGLSPTETKKDNYRDSEKEFRERLQPSQDDYELSETEVPPAPQTDNKVYLSKSNKEFSSIEAQKDYFKNSVKELRERLQPSEEEYELSEIEVSTPPQTDNKEYSQGNSSASVDSVLSNLRNMQFHKRDKAISVNNPLHKISDAFPYSSELKLTKIKPPAQFERRNLGGNPNPSYSDLFNKRRPKYNVGILKDDLREKIHRSLSKLKARNVNVMTGKPELSKQNNEHHERFNRQVRYSSSESDESIETPSPWPFTISDNQNIISEINKGLNNNKNLQNLFIVQPYKKTLKDIIEDSKKNQTLRNMYKRDVYNHSLSNGNQWHNIQSSSNDYTPRKVDVHSTNPDDIRSELVKNNSKRSIQQSQSLAETVSSQAEVSLNQIENPDIPHPPISIQQLVHEFSLSNNTKREKGKKILHSRNFNKQVKLENALNEINALSNKYSFEGGDCKNVELHELMLYIQPDESVDISRFLSPWKMKNHAIEFIQRSYKMCSYEGSLFESDPLLYINWSKSPVSLVGGSYLQITTDFCGFFKR